MFNYKAIPGLVAASLITIGGSATAQSVEEFYGGKTITMTVAAGGGGMADSVARAFADIFASHIPGHPDVVIQNVPGGGGLVGATKLKSAGATDGTEVGFLLGNVITAPLITGNNQFDPREVQWLGAIDSGDYPRALFAYESSPVQSADALFADNMEIGATSFSHYNRVFPAMLQEYAGAKLNIVAGYKGSGEVNLAMERGEVDGWVTGSQHIRAHVGRAGEWIKEGKLVPLVLFAAEPDPRHPDLPVVMDYIKEPEQKAIANFLFAASKVGRPLAVPADVPADRVEALRAAVVATFEDPAFAEFVASSGLGEAQLQTVGEIEGLIAGFYGTPEATLEAVRAFTTN